MKVLGYKKKDIVMRRKIFHLSVVITVLILFSGCGGASGPKDNGSSYTPQTHKHAVSSKAEASAFLSRSTFGATEEGIDNLVNLADYDEWIDSQFSKAPNYHMVWAHKHAKGIGSVLDLNASREDWKTYSDALGDLQRDA